MSEDPVATAITTRRTSLRMDPDEPLDESVITGLCRLAVWAPNHHRTEPWRFAAFSGDARRRLGETIAAEMSAWSVAAERVAKTRTKYLRAPTMLLVGSAAGPDATTTLENRDAVAAGVQNILLGATEMGLTSFWSSVATPHAAALLDLCGFETDTVVIAAVYLGHPNGEVAAPPRRSPRITFRR